MGVDVGDEPVDVRGHPPRARDLVLAVHLHAALHRPADVLVDPVDDVVARVGRVDREDALERVRDVAPVAGRADRAAPPRAVDAELKGIPLRVEVGPRDVAEGRVTVARRIAGGKEPVGVGGVVDHCTRALVEDQQALYDEALRRRDELTHDVTSVDEAREAAQTGFARIPWATLGTEGERKTFRPARVTCSCRAHACLRGWWEPVEGRGSHLV